MKLELMIDGFPVLTREVNEPTKTNVERAVTFMTRTQEEVLADRAARRAVALAKLPEAERVKFLAVEALPEDERKLEYAKQQQAALQAKLVQMESTVATMTAAVAKKPVLVTPTKQPAIEP